MNPIQIVGRWIFGKRLENTGPALTFARICTSRHLADLQWIAFFLILILVVLVPAEISISGISVFGTNLPLFFSALAAAAAAILSWIYQTGSSRIGAVDLFACEITAICRVSLVTDFAKNSVAHARSLANGQGRVNGFNSEEDYTPVYNRQLHELQPLDVNVVTSVTEFYTYRKTMVDYLRAVAASEDPKQRRGLQLMMIYMQHLMYESARRAVDALIEFEPNKAESKVNILSSEMVTYGFLVESFPREDFRDIRLRLRAREYHAVVPALEHRIRTGPHPTNWDRARTTVREMRARYEAMCAEIGEAPAIASGAPA